MATSCMALSHSSKTSPPLSCELSEPCNSLELFEEFNGFSDGGPKDITGGATDDVGTADEADSAAGEAKGDVNDDDVV